MKNHLFVGVLFFFTALAAYAADAIPSCRLDNSMKSVVTETLQRSLLAFNEMGRTLPFDKIVVNPTTALAIPGTLTVYVIKDATQGETNAKGCTKGPAKKDEKLDKISVHGGCVASAAEKLELRCSSDTVKLFSHIGKREGRANPALLYLLSHELGHLFQRQAGNYSDRAQTIELGNSKETKLGVLIKACKPAMTRREEAADTYAFDVLKKLVPYPPYREPLFSEHGSLFWNMDQLAIAATEWQNLSLIREFISRPKMHASFVPTEFPTSQSMVEANARQFVCDVLTKQKGQIILPVIPSSHPPMEQRLRHIAEILKGVADSLPDTGGQEQFEPIVRLQNDLSPIFTHIYRETGIYLENVHKSICTIVNSPQPEQMCQ